MFSKKVLSIMCLAGAMFAIPSTKVLASTSVTVSPAIVSTMEKHLEFKLDNDTDENVTVDWTAELISNDKDYLNYIKLDKTSGKIAPNKRDIVPVTISGDFKHVEMPVKLKINISSSDVEDGNISVNRSFEIPIFHKTKEASKVPLNYEVSEPELIGNISEVPEKHLLNLILFNKESWELQTKGNMRDGNVYDIRDFENIAYGSVIDNKSEVSFPFSSSITLGISGVNPIVDIEGKSQVASPKNETSIIYGLPANAVEALVNSKTEYIGVAEVNADKQTIKTSNIRFSTIRTKFLIWFFTFYGLVLVSSIIIAAVIRNRIKESKKEKARELEEKSIQEKEKAELLKDRTEEVLADAKVIEDAPTLDGEEHNSTFDLMETFEAEKEVVDAIFNSIETISLDEVEEVQVAEEVLEETVTEEVQVEETLEEEKSTEDLEDTSTDVVIDFTNEDVLNTTIGEALGDTDLFNIVEDTTEE